MTNIARPTEEMAVVVNGELRRVGRGTSLGALLRSLNLDPRMVVVEHNRVIVRDRAVYPSRMLAGGDVLEIVHFVGGG